MDNGDEIRLMRRPIYKKCSLMCGEFYNKKIFLIIKITAFDIKPSDLRDLQWYSLHKIN
jgi:hypothetical protein